MLLLVGLGGGGGRVLTLAFPSFAFDPPENVRKSLVLRRFQGDQKGILRMKGLNIRMFNYTTMTHFKPISFLYP